MHEFYSTVSPEGRVTIPRAIRRMLNLRASDRVEFRVVDGRITIAPVRSVLAEHYQSVPPLKTSLTPEEVVGLAIDEQVEEAASEGLDSMEEREVHFLDTNVFLRYFTGDDPEKGRRAYALLQQVEQGVVTATTSEGVLLEIVFVLSGKRTYNRPRGEVRKRLSDVLSLPGLLVRNKSAYLRALELFELNQTIDFVDCLNVALMEQEGISTIWTFDRDYDRMLGSHRITRREP